MTWLQEQSGSAHVEEEMETLIHHVREIDTQQKLLGLTGDQQLSDVANLAAETTLHHSTKKVGSMVTLCGREPFDQHMDDNITAAQTALVTHEQEREQACQLTEAMDLDSMTKYATAAGVDTEDIKGARKFATDKKNTIVNLIQTVLDAKAQPMLEALQAKLCEARANKRLFNETVDEHHATTDHGAPPEPSHPKQDSEQGSDDESHVSASEQGSGDESQDMAAAAADTVYSLSSSSSSGSCVDGLDEVPVKGPGVSGLSPQVKVWLQPVLMAFRSWHGHTQEVLIMKQTAARVVARLTLMHQAVALNAWAECVRTRKTSTREVEVEVTTAHNVTSELSVGASHMPMGSPALSCVSFGGSVSFISAPNTPSTPSPMKAATQPQRSPLGAEPPQRGSSNLLGAFSADDEPVMISTTTLCADNDHHSVIASMHGDGDGGRLVSVFSDMPVMVRRAWQSAANDSHPDLIRRHTNIILCLLLYTMHDG